MPRLALAENCYDAQPASDNVDYSLVRGRNSLMSRDPKLTLALAGRAASARNGVDKDSHFAYLDFVKTLEADYRHEEINGRLSREQIQAKCELEDFRREAEKIIIKREGLDAEDWGVSENIDVMMDAYRLRQKFLKAGRDFEARTPDQKKDPYLNIADPRIVSGNGSVDIDRQKYRVELRKNFAENAVAQKLVDDLVLPPKSLEVTDPVSVARASRLNEIASPTPEKTGLRGMFGKAAEATKSWFNKGVSKVKSLWG